MSIFEKNVTQTVSQKEQIIPIAWLKSSKKPVAAPNYSDVMVSHSDGRLSQYLVGLINQAQETIVICSFLLAHQAIEDAVFQAAERGVRVCLMLASEHRLEKNSDDEFSRKCEQQHKDMLKRLADKVLIRSAPHFHAKAVLIDALNPDNSNAKGVLLTANITHEALERNEELAVVLPRQAIDELVQFFRWGFFSEAQHQMLDNQKFSSIDKKAITYPKHQQIMCFTSSQEQGILNRALQLIDNAKQEIVIASFGFDEQHALVQTLCQKAKQGIDVKILARIRPSNMNALILLKQAGAKIYGFKWLHAKAIWVGGQSAMVMSANLQKHGLDEGFEIGVNLDGQSVRALKNNLDYFVSQADYELAINLPIGGYLGELKYWENQNFTDLTIQAEKQENLSDVIADCVSDLTKEAVLPKTDWRNKPVHKIIYQYKVLAPTLPQNAKEIFWEEKKAKLAPKTNKKGKNKDNIPEFEIIRHSYIPKVFGANGKQYIAISKESELHQAVQLRDKQFKQAKIILQRENKS